MLGQEFRFHQSLQAIQTFYIYFHLFIGIRAPFLYHIF